MTATTLHRARPEPATVRPGRDTARRKRARAQWLIVSAALVVLAATLVTWALRQASGRVDVVVAAGPIAAGSIIDADDLTVAAVAVDAQVTGLVPAAAMSRLVGFVATVDLDAGAPIVAGMWADETELSDDERSVGALLDAGRFPLGLARGSAAIAVPLETATTSVIDASDPVAPIERSASTPADAAIEVRVLDAQLDERGALAVTLAVPADVATRVGQLAATDQLVLVGLPVAIDPARGAPADTDGSGS
jgi:hypothetical protein